MSEEKQEVKTQAEEKQSETQKESSNFNLESILGEDLYQYYLNNKKQSTSILIGLATIIVAFLGYKFVYIDMIVVPTEKESIEKIWEAEAKAFEEQDWATAINGDSLGFFSGFKNASENYSGSNGGEIAKYNLGISYLNNKEYKEAILTLKEVSFDDELLGTISLGAIGDAFAQIGQPEDAYDYYVAAFEASNNLFSAPKYLYKAGMLGANLGKNKVALSYFKRIKSDYPDADEAKLVEVQIGRLENLR